MSEKRKQYLRRNRCSPLQARGGVLKHIDTQHPPDKKYRDDCPRDMNDPVADCFWFAKIKHDGIVAWGLKPFGVSKRMQWHSGTTRNREQYGQQH
jgi:hypothetical protein